MSKINIIATDSTIEVARDLFQKFGCLKDKDATELKIECHSRHIKLAMEYMEHHQKAEVAAPAGQIQLTWTVDNVFTDKWDTKFFQRVLESEADPLLRAFSTAVHHLDAPVLFRKTVCVIGIGMVTAAGGVKGDKLATEFSRLAAKVDKDNREESKEDVADNLAQLSL